VDILLEREELDGEEFRQIVAEYTALPEKPEVPENNSPLAIA
jgi:cell division protease FtsH